MKSVIIAPDEHTMNGQNRSPEFVALAEIVGQLKQYFDRSEVRFDRLEITIQKNNDALVMKVDAVEQDLEEKIEQLEQEGRQRDITIARLETQLQTLNRICTAVAVAIFGAMVAIAVPNWFRSANSGASAKPIEPPQERRQIGAVKSAPIP
jgi:septation ring formation regulator EzrA